MLGLQPESVRLAVHRAARAHERRVEEIAGIELDAGFGRRDFHDTPGRRLANPGSEAQRAGTRLVEDPAVVVAAPEYELLAVAADTGADRSRYGELPRPPGALGDPRPEQPRVGNK